MFCFSESRAPRAVENNIQSSWASRIFRCLRPLVISLIVKEWSVELDFWRRETTKESLQRFQQTGTVINKLLRFLLHLTCLAFLLLVCCSAFHFFFMFDLSYFWLYRIVLYNFMLRDYFLLFSVVQSLILAPFSNVSREAFLLL